MKKTIMILGILMLGLALIACEETAPTKNAPKDVNTYDPDAAPKEQQMCDSASDCVPLPGCHARACINKVYEKDYRQPEVCTELFDCSAAYKASDCECVDGRCWNRNIDNQGCES
ncbi:hypothetical protein ACFL0V_02310 [Nanoarchaeota archaeon]